MDSTVHSHSAEMLCYMAGSMQVATKCVVLACCSQDLMRYTMETKQLDFNALSTADTMDSRQSQGKNSCVCNKVG